MRYLSSRVVESVVVAVVMLAAACASAPAMEGRQVDSVPLAIRPSGLGEDVDRDVARVRASTQTFRSLDRAVAAGYSRNGGGCVDNPPAGAMGFHHQNDALLDAQLDVERPEMLVYERLRDGTYRLNGVEYIVPFSAWPETKEAPTVMGQKLKPAPSLRIWYRHVWVWQDNPSGLFADWNPRVKC